MEWSIITFQTQLEKIITGGKKTLCYRHTDEKNHDKPNLTFFLSITGYLNLIQETQ